MNALQDYLHKHSNIDGKSKCAAGGEEKERGKEGIFTTHASYLGRNFSSDYIFNYCYSYFK